MLKKCSQSVAGQTFGHDCSPASSLQPSASTIIAICQLSPSISQPAVKPNHQPSADCNPSISHMLPCCGKPKGICQQAPWKPLAALLPASPSAAKESQGNESESLENLTHHSLLLGIHFVSNLYCFSVVIQLLCYIFYQQDQHLTSRGISRRKPWKWIQCRKLPASHYILCIILTIIYCCCVFISFPLSRILKSIWPFATKPANLYGKH